jgi:predicted DNA repair protein MutK
MAGGILALLDDVAMLLDDTAVMSKLAAKKAAGLLGDDLAVNAEKATGFHASRELPVIWAITKGALLNKAIILPMAFLLSAFMPWLIVPILLLGGAYLSYEGMEKVIEWFTRPDKQQPKAYLTEDKDDILQSEAKKIKSAIRTDFILSVEIIIISLDTVIEKSLTIQILVVSMIALLATAAVYGVVALLVRMDDAGLHLLERANRMQAGMAKLTRVSGMGLINALPKVIRVLGIIGTVAMLLVGGGMYVHNIEAVHHLLEVLPGLASELVAGVVVGLVLVGLMHLKHKLFHSISGVST